jgi:hypothetical protein
MKLRYDAQIALEMLNSSSGTDDIFVKMFLEDHRTLASRFDIILRYRSNNCITT